MFLCDGAIVEVENAYKKLELWQSGGRKGDFHEVRLEALLEVGPSIFFSLAVVAVSFLPIFTLVDQEGRLFKPLAYTKTLTMIMATFLVITLDPAMQNAVCPDGSIPFQAAYCLPGFSALFLSGSIIRKNSIPSAVCFLNSMKLRADLC